MLVIGARDGLPANQPAVCPQQPSLLVTGETTKDAQGMPRQDTDTPRVRGPLRSEPSRSDPSHTAPYSRSFKLPASLSACVVSHRLPQLLQLPANHPPQTPGPPAPFPARRQLSHHNLLKTGQPRWQSRRAPLVRARLATPLPALLFFHRHP